MLSTESFAGPRALGEESLQMWDLNKRLEAYLARVKFLEEENEVLRAEIQSTKSGPAGDSWRAKYEEELRALRDALDVAFREKCTAELARDNLYEEVQQVKSRCQKEQAAREEAKKQLALSRKELEEERRAQIWLKERAVQLEKEVEALLEVHEEEKAGLDQEIASFSHSLESFRCAPVAFQPVEVEDYSKRLSEIWKGAVETYKAEVAQLEGSLCQAKENLWKAVEDNQQSQLQLQHLEKDLAGLKARKEMLEESLARQWQEQRGEAEKFQLAMEALEQEQQSLRVQIARVLEDRQQLMHLKMSLSLEVATYRTLLEAESSRLQVPAGEFRVANGVRDLKLEVSSGKAVPVSPEARRVLPPCTPFPRVTKTPQNARKISSALLGSAASGAGGLGAPTASPPRAGRGIPPLSPELESSGGEGPAWPGGDEAATSRGMECPLSRAPGDSGSSASLPPLGAHRLQYPAQLVSEALEDALKEMGDDAQPEEEPRGSSTWDVCAHSPVFPPEAVPEGPGEGSEDGESPEAEERVREVMLQGLAGESSILQDTAPSPPGMDPPLGAAGSREDLGAWEEEEEEEEEQVPAVLSPRDPEMEAQERDKDLPGQTKTSWEKPEQERAETPSTEPSHPSEDEEEEEEKGDFQEERTDVQEEECPHREEEAAGAVLVESHLVLPTEGHLEEDFADAEQERAEQQEMPVCEMELAAGKERQQELCPEQEPSSVPEAIPAEEPPTGAEGGAVAGEDTGRVENAGGQEGEASREVLGGEDHRVGQDPMAGEDLTAGEDSEAGEDHGAGEDLEAGENLGAGEDLEAGEDFGAGEDLGAGEDFGAGEDLEAGEDFGAGELGAGEDLGAGELGAGEDFGAGEDLGAGELGAGENFGAGEGSESGEDFGAGEAVAGDTLEGDSRAPEEPEELQEREEEEQEELEPWGQGGDDGSGQEPCPEDWEVTAGDTEGLLGAEEPDTLRSAGRLESPERGGTGPAELEEAQEEDEEDAKSQEMRQQQALPEAEPAAELARQGSVAQPEPGAPGPGDRQELAGAPEEPRELQGEDPAEGLSPELGELESSGLVAPGQVPGDNTEWALEEPSRAPELTELVAPEQVPGDSAEWALEEPPRAPELTEGTGRRVELEDTLPDSTPLHLYQGEMLMGTASPNPAESQGTTGTAPVCATAQEGEGWLQGRGEPPTPSMPESPEEEAEGAEEEEEEGYFMVSAPNQEVSSSEEAEIPEDFEEIEVEATEGSQDDLGAPGEASPGPEGREHLEVLAAEAGEDMELPTEEPEVPKDEESAAELEEGPAEDPSCPGGVEPSAGGSDEPAQGVPGSAAWQGPEHPAGLAAGADEELHTTTELEGDASGAAARLGLAGQEEQEEDEDEPSTALHDTTTAELQAQAVPDEAEKALEEQPATEEEVLGSESPPCPGASPALGQGGSPEAIPDIPDAAALPAELPAELVKASGILEIVEQALEFNQELMGGRVAEAGQGPGRREPSWDAGEDPEPSWDAEEDPELHRDAGEDPELHRDAEECPELHRDAGEGSEPFRDAEEDPEPSWDAEEDSDLPRDAGEDPELHRDAGEDPELHRDAEECPELPRDAEEDPEPSRDAGEDPELPRDAEEGSELPRDAEEGSELPRDAEEGSELPRNAEECPELHRDAEEGSELLRDAGEDPELPRDAREGSELPRDAGEDPELSRDAEENPELSRDAGEDPEPSRDAGEDPELSRDAEECPELPQDAEEDSELSRDAGEDPELPRDAEQDPELPRDVEEGSELPRDAGEDPELPRDAEEDPELPRDAEEDPELPRDAGEDPELPRDAGDSSSLASSSEEEPTVQEAPEPEAALRAQNGLHRAASLEELPEFTEEMPNGTSGTAPAQELAEEPSGVMAPRAPTPGGGTATKLGDGSLRGKQLSPAAPALGEDVLSLTAQQAAACGLRAEQEPWSSGDE